MQRVLNRFIYVALAAMLLVACSDEDSRTDLNSEGPPMIRQVRMTEKYLDTTNPAMPVEKERPVFAFGTHELAEDDEVVSTRPAGMVTSASALKAKSTQVNRIRVIVDELLVGNYLEEIACRGQVDVDFLARVPIGATPEDIARCSGPDDVLPETCPASNKLSVCICNNPNGCLANTKLVPMGMPVGVADIDKDGAADDTELINGSVKILCGPNRSINVPLDLKSSYWNPSGDQNRPALGGFDALGPAIVISPLAALPTNVECQLAFADGTLTFPDANDPATPLPAISDKQNLKLCAPPNGDVAQPCAADGDVSLFKFKVEPMAYIPGDSSVANGAMNVPRNITAPSILRFVFNVPIAVSSLAAGVTITPALPAGATLTVGGTGFARNLEISAPAGTLLAASTTYTITISTALTDTYGQPLPAPVVITFTTAP
jgi:hypothetical protein